jgi:hypothetical protein
MGGDGPGQSRRVYRDTQKGRKAMAAAKVKVCELFPEPLEEERPEGDQLHNTAEARNLMKELVIEVEKFAPPSASPNLSSQSLCAPVNAPPVCPKNSDSKSMFL